MGAGRIAMPWYYLNGNFSTIAYRKYGPIATGDCPSDMGSAHEIVILVIK